VEAFCELIDPLLKGLQPLLILLNEGQDCRLGSRRYLVPEFSRNRRNRRHINILRPIEARTSSGRERLPQGETTHGVQSRNGAVEALEARRGMPAASVSQGASGRIIDGVERRYESLNSTGVFVG
jgi:hypothetical protein